MKRYRIRNTIRGKYYIEERYWFVFWFEIKHRTLLSAPTILFDSLEDAENWIIEEKNVIIKNEDAKRNFKNKVWYRD